jgi:hypothetical protein
VAFFIIYLDLDIFKFELYAQVKITTNSSNLISTVVISKHAEEQG